MTVKHLVGWKGALEMLIITDNESAARGPAEAESGSPLATGTQMSWLGQGPLTAPAPGGAVSLTHIPGRPKDWTLSSKMTDDQTPAESLNGRTLIQFGSGQVIMLRDEAAVT